MERKLLLMSWKSMFFTGFIFASLAFIALLFTQKNFQARTDFLVVQNQGSQDFYSLSRSNEYLSNVLGEAIYSELFISEALKTGIISDSLLPRGRQDRLDVWGNMIQVERNFQKNALSVVVYHDSNNDAINISKSIAEVLTKHNALFRSGADNAVELRIMSGPISRSNPSVADILLTVFAGFAAGGALLFGKNLWRQQMNRAMIDDLR